MFSLISLVSATSLSINSTRAVSVFAKYLTFGQSGRWSGIDDDFASRATEQYFHTVQHISPEDALVTTEIRWEPTWVVPPVEVGPGRKDNCHHGSIANAAHQPRGTFPEIQVQLLTVRP